MNILLNRRACILLQSVAKQNGKLSINDMGKNAYATYKSRWEVINELESSGVVFLEKFGKEVMAYLTPDGERILKYINHIISLQPKGL